MNIKSLKIESVKLLTPKLFQDYRGFFYESFNSKIFSSLLGENVSFVQDNHSRSSKFVLRGLHYQKPPYEQGKLVRVTTGEVFDVAVDVRPNSLTFGHWVGEHLSDKNQNQLWIPPGFAHGFLVLSDYADFLYKTTNYYNKESEMCIRYDDPDLAINWPSKKNIILSQKDKEGLLLNNFLTVLMNEN